MSIIVKNITKLYGKQKALNNVSFSINSGDIVGFLGPNGAGKSTMMKIIAGFIPPNSGTVEVAGFDILKDSLKVRQTIGYLPEHNPLYLDMYVKEYLEFVSRIYTIDNMKSRIKEMIEKTGLQVEQNKRIGALSKGYRQRVGLAQVLIHDPKVLILDEPTTGLDPNQIGEIRNLIADIGKEKTVMLSTHIMQEVEAICDKVIIINKGEIVADDTTQNIHSHVKQHYQTVLIEFSDTVNPEQLETIEGVLKVRRVDNNNWLVQSRADKDVRTDIFNFAVENKLTVLSLQKKEKNLEEVFQELTK